MGSEVFKKYITATSVDTCAPKLVFVRVKLFYGILRSTEAICINLYQLSSNQLHRDVLQALEMIFITLRACARGKAISFVCLLSVVVVKIARSPHLGISSVTCKYDKSIEIGDKLASLYFKSIGKAHECHKYGVFIGHAYRLQAMCYLLMHTSLKHYTRASSRRRSIQDTHKMQRTCGVCALESSSLTCNYTKCPRVRVQCSFSTRDFNYLGQKFEGEAGVKVN